MDRKLNYLFSFLLVIIFVSAADGSHQWHTLMGILLATIFSFIAYLFRRLTLDGMFASIVVGVFIFGFGGWPAAVVILLFFISSAIISRSWKMRADDLSGGARRNGLQVWANGIWIVLSLALYISFTNSLFIISAMAAIATATSDTWATELGRRANSKTYLITNFKEVAPGTDGGVSFMGTVSALLGSGMIATAVLYVFELSHLVFISIFLAGFLGCLIDSYLGAVFQRNNKSVNLPVGEYIIPIENNIVNVISTGAGALLAIIFKFIFV